MSLLHKDADAEQLIGRYRLEDRGPDFCDDFHQPLGMNSQYFAVLAREFPARLTKVNAADLNRILQPIANGEFNTLSAAYAVRALKAYSSAVARNLPELSITELGSNNHVARLAAGARLLQRADLSGDARAVRFQSAKRISGPGMFFQVVEAGFDRERAATPLRNGLEVYRELLDQNGVAVSKTSLGRPVRVRLHVRSLERKPVTNVAIIDLLPGGFEVMDSSLPRGRDRMRGVDYIDVREDRAVFFATVPVYGLEIDYQIKSCNRGDFVVPPVFAESMYDRNVKARGVGGKMVVTP